MVLAGYVIRELKMYKYEKVLCTYDGRETVVQTFFSEYSDLTVNDNRAIVAIFHNEYIRGVEND